MPGSQTLLPLLSLSPIRDWKVLCRDGKTNEYRTFLGGTLRPAPVRTVPTGS